MINCDIPRIEYAFYTEIYKLLLLPIVVVIFKIVLSKFTDLNLASLNEGRIDKNSGLKILEPKNIRNLLAYPFAGRLRLLLTLIFLSLIFRILYLIFKDVPPLNYSLAYDCTIVVFTWLGLVPLVVSFFISFFLLLKIIELIRS